MGIIIVWAVASWGRGLFDSHQRATTTTTTTTIHLKGHVQLEYTPIISSSTPHQPAEGRPTKTMTKMGNKNIIVEQRREESLYVYPWWSESIRWLYM